MRPKIDAVFAANDPSAIGAMKAIWEAGLRVPDDIAVVGVGDIALGDLLRVPLTTVGWSRTDQGRHAAELHAEQPRRGQRRRAAAHHHPAASHRPRVVGSRRGEARARVALGSSVTFDCGSGLRSSGDADGVNPRSDEPQSEMAPAERERVIAAADRYLTRPPQTITAFRAARSAGGPHDFFSEGDYWWPDPKNPDGPYIRRDGESNPGNFVDHRRALVRLSVEVPALTAAWKLTSDDRYAAQARRHLRAWFVDPSTRMTPSLEYAQAIHGIATGRGTGIIDTIHLVEVARAIEVLERGGALPGAELQPIARGLRTTSAG